MKKTLIALMALASVAAAAETTTYTPLNSLDNWTFGKGQPKGANLTIDTEYGTITNTNSNWNKSYAVYDFGTNALALEDGHSIGFSFVLGTSNSNSGVMTVTLIDNAGLSIVLGEGNYDNTNLDYGTTTSTVAETLYVFSGASAGGVTGVTSLGTVKTAPASGFASMSGTITMTAGEAILDLGDDHIVNLGEGFTLNKLVVGYEGDGGDANAPSISFLTISHTTPEPATATLSLLALAGLAARRRRH